MIENVFARAIGGRGFIPDFDSKTMDMKRVLLSYGDKVFYNSKKGKVEAGFFLAVSDDPKDNLLHHRQTCYVLFVESDIPVVTKVSAYYLLKADWDNKLSPSSTLTQSYSLLNYIEQNKK